LIRFLVYFERKEYNRPGLDFDRWSWISKYGAGFRLMGFDLD
jgi:hypothetical protein